MRKKDMWTWWNYQHFQSTCCKKCSCFSWSKAVLTGSDSLNGLIGSKRAHCFISTRTRWFTHRAQRVQVQNEDRTFSFQKLLSCRTRYRSGTSCVTASHLSDLKFLLEPMTDSVILLFTFFSDWTHLCLFIDAVLISSGMYFMSVLIVLIFFYEYENITIHVWRVSVRCRWEEL